MNNSNKLIVLSKKYSKLLSQKISFISTFINLMKDKTVF